MCGMAKRIILDNRAIRNVHPKNGQENVNKSDFIVIWFIDTIEIKSHNNRSKWLMNNFNWEKIVRFISLL